MSNFDMSSPIIIVILFFHSRHSCKCFFCRCNGSVNIFVRMRAAHKEGFKLGRGKVDALFEHGLEPDLEFFLVGVARILIIQHVFFAEEDAEHGAGLMGLNGHACGFGFFLPAEEQFLRL